MNWSSTEFPPEVSEVEALGLKTEASAVVKPPRLAMSPASFEGREIQTLLIGENQIVVGELLVAHVRDEFIDAQTLRVRGDSHDRAVAGGKGGGYARTRDTFHLKRLTYEEWKGAVTADRPVRRSPFLTELTEFFGINGIGELERRRN